MRLSKLAIPLIIIAILYLSFKYEQYMYRDCLRVGHSGFYCFMRIGK